MIRDPQTLLAEQAAKEAKETAEKNKTDQQWRDTAVIAEHTMGERRSADFISNLRFVCISVIFHENY